MMSSDLKFKLHISLRRSSDDGPVFHKQDGERFDQPVTVKLNVDTDYNILFTTRPAVTIRKVLLRGEEISLEPQKREKEGDDALVYHADWNTNGFVATKSNDRFILPFSIEMSDGLIVTPKLQIKMYPAKELSHSKWGQEFHLLNLECHRPKGSTALNIEEKYI